jgi:hypothetical protein
MTRKWRSAGWQLAGPSILRQRFAFSATVAEVQSKSGHDSEVWRLVGHWKPFHFHSTFVS